MTLEQTRQKWYNRQILCFLIPRMAIMEINLHNIELHFKWKRQYMKAKMEQQLKKGKK